MDDLLCASPELSHNFVLRNWNRGNERLYRSFSCRGAMVTLDFQSQDSAVLESYVSISLDNFTIGARATGVVSDRERRLESIVNLVYRVIEQAQKNASRMYSKGSFGYERV